MMDDFRPPLSRRMALKSLSSGFGYLAFAATAQQANADRAGTEIGQQALSTHFPAKAKRVILLSMNGGPSHVDLFDRKPALAHHEGQQLKPKSIGKATLLPSPFQFAQHGKSGSWVSELLPEVSKHVDDLCFIKSMHTDLPNHSQAYLQMHNMATQGPHVVSATNSKTQPIAPSLL